MTTARATFLLVVIRGLLLATATSLLTGCISLFPNADPAQLYRFGTTAPQAQNTSAGEVSFGVLMLELGFTRASANDRILTVNETQVAYIKSSRWITSAKDLFKSAVQRAFDADNGPARLVGVGDIAKPSYALKLDVRTFEARYDSGQNAAPAITVVVHATLARTHDQVVVGNQSFNASITANDNRVGAIVDAFDQAVAQVLGALVTWVDAQGEGTEASNIVQF